MASVCVVCPDGLLLLSYCFEGACRLESLVLALFLPLAVGAVGAVIFSTLSMAKPSRTE
jgi:hypothetical protein